MFNINNGIGDRTDCCVYVITATEGYIMPTSYESFITYINYVSFITILLGEIDPFPE